MRYEIQCIVTKSTDDDLATILIRDVNNNYEAEAQTSELNSASCKAAFAQFGVGYWDAVLKKDIEPEEETE